MGHTDSIVECEDTIERSPPEGWGMLTPLPAAAVAANANGHGPHRAGPASREFFELVKPSPELLMEQRVVARDERLMLLRYEMTRSRNLPWCACESSLRVEPIGHDHARVVVTALVTPA